MTIQGAFWLGVALTIGGVVVVYHIWEGLKESSVEEPEDNHYGVQVHRDYDNWNNG